MVTTTQMIMVMKLWLENKKAHKKYYREVKKHNGWLCGQDPLEWFATNDAKSLIAGAFSWHVSSDPNCWPTLDKEWRKFYKEFMENYQ